MDRAVDHVVFTTELLELILSFLSIGQLADVAIAVPEWTDLILQSPILWDTRLRELGLQD